MINIAITKGRLEDETIKIFKKCKFDVEPLINKGRKLVFYDKDNRFKYFLVKGADSITYVEHGVADIGIVGKDVLMENHINYYELMDLNIGKCKFILAAKKDTKIFNTQKHIKIGTKYPNVAKQYFDMKNMNVEIIKIEGSVELSPILQLCDGIVDIMETGTTLRENGLEVKDEICDLSARVICNIPSFKLKNKEILEFIECLREAVN